MYRNYNNPYAKRWVNEFGRWNEPNHDERHMYEVEASHAESQPSYPCEVEGCTGTTYYRPGVGGWWCDTCRGLRSQNNG
jgi:hypothetical protein